MIAMGFVCGRLERMMLAITMIGTQRNIPAIPQMLPQKASEMIITKPLIFIDLPISFGSITFPIRNCVVIRREETIIKGDHESNCTIVSRQGSIVAVIDPMVGMKLSKKMSSDQNSAKSTPIAFMMA